MRIDPERLLECAEAAAKAAGDYALSQTRRRGEVFRRLSHDVKLNLDIECQAVATRSILSTFPRHRVLGEEDACVTTAYRPDFYFSGPSGPIEAEGAGVLWIVDPLDGTVNFSHGLPLWCCSVAASVGNRIVAGVVYAPALGRCYTASTGRPATCNGRRIRVSGVRRLPDALVVTGMDRHLGEPFSLFNAVASKVQRARILGSAALDLCSVAEGAADAYIEAGIYIWDIAAGGLIVRQAGGRVELLATLDGNRLFFLADNGHTHTAMKRLSASASRTGNTRRSARR